MKPHTAAFGAVQPAAPPEGFPVKKSGIIGAVALVLVVGSCINRQSADQVETSAAAASASASTSAAAVPDEGTSSASVAPVGEAVAVSRVIDGDTFELADGRSVRLLGIDSCEIGTYGGEEAKSMLEGQLTNPYNQPIRLMTEPGVEADQYGRLLRYVSMEGEYDLGEFMVKYDHTGVYQGKGGASKAYVDRLYAADLEYAANPPAGRACADPYAEYRTDTDVDVYVDGDGDFNMPDGALTGGYCARKWWC
jgi:endonuclease YncB( thermonuclease family)